MLVKFHQRSLKTLVAVSVIAVLTIALTSSSITPALAQPSYTQLTQASAAQTPGSIKLSVSTAGIIPRFPDSFILSVLVFGYAWVNTGTSNAVVAVIHPSFRDSNQNPASWHTHTVTLSTGTASSNFCIQQLGTSQAGIAIINNLLRVNIAINQAGGNLNPNAAASFIVQHDSGCSATGLGVMVISGPIPVS